MKKNLKNKYYSPQKKVLSKSYSFKALNMTKFGAVQAQWMHSMRVESKQEYECYKMKVPLQSDSSAENISANYGGW
jgi:hypothetical protein